MVRNKMKYAKLLLVTAFLLVPLLTLTGCPAGQAEAGPDLPSPPSPDQREEVAVVEFENSTRIRGLGAGMAEMLDSELLQSGWFDVYTRRDLEQIKEEHALQTDPAFIDESTAVEAGQIVGIDYIIMGNVTSVNTEPYEVEMSGVGVGGTVVEVDVSLQMLDVETGRLVASPYVSGENFSPEFSLERGDLPQFAFGDGSDYADSVEDAVEEAALEAVNEVIMVLDR